MTNTTNTIKIIAIAIIIVLTQIFGATAAFANSDATSFVSGTVWADENGNNIQDLTETALPNATVFMQSLETREVFTTTSDANGVYMMSNVPFGRYAVWGEAGNTVTDTHVVEVSELGGAAAFDFGVNTAAADMEMNEMPAQTFTTFLPLVQN
ncbi:MAG: SdrD B-like domain-containing protein [Chloroflexota bacterium]